MNLVSAARTVVLPLFLALVSQSNVRCEERTENAGPDTPKSHSKNLVQKQVVHPAIKQWVLEEVSPESVSRALGQAPVEKGPSVRLHERWQWVPETGVSDCREGPTHQPTRKWYMVTRPNDDTFVAVIADLTSEPALLNPTEYFVYNSIPALKDMTETDAGKIWGTPKDTAVSKTYRLTSTDQKKRVKEFFVDVRFENGRIQEYRVSGVEISNPGWRKLH